MEIIHLVEHSPFSMKKILQKIQISESTFYLRYKRYQEDGLEGLDRLGTQMGVPPADCLIGLETENSILGDFLWIRDTPRYLSGHRIWSRAFAQGSEIVAQKMSRKVLDKMLPSCKQIKADYNAGNLIAA